MLDGIVTAACAAATIAAGLRWLRVAQREHYLPDAASRFALRWWLGAPPNMALFAVGVAGLLAAARWPISALATAAVVAAGPVGLGLRGRTSALAWTRRLRTLAAVWGSLQAAALVAGVLAGIGPVAAAAGSFVVPALVDLACALTAPVERRLAGRFVARARQRLRRVAPTVVAITGSYGKTSTKGYVAHLLQATKSVVASPASFNNRAGLARAVNEHLAEGTDVFVAEMGTYGRGEIAELCSWITPDISVITAIGPVHLERFGTEQSIVEAKAEILAPASCVVLVVDDERLAALADRCELDGKKVWRVSSSTHTQDVCVEEGAEETAVWVGGERIGFTTCDVRPGNLGCAVAVAVQLGVALSVVASLLSDLPTAAHRLQVSDPAPDQCTVLDDTYNSNPAGAEVAIGVLESTGTADHRRALVTPGMVELGRGQFEENAALAERAARVATDIVVVGRTNRRALLTGVARAAAHDDAAAVTVVSVGSREDAVAWVRHHLGPGDVALFENDLPDHYP